MVAPLLGAYTLRSGHSRRCGQDSCKQPPHWNKTSVVVVVLLVVERVGVGSRAHTHDNMKVGMEMDDSAL